MVMIDGPVSDEIIGMYIERIPIETILNSYLNWVSNADNKLRDMDEDKIKLLRPILDKLSRGMYSITKDLYGSLKEVSSYDHGLFSGNFELKTVAETFYWNEYNDNDIDDIKYDLNSDYFLNLKGVDILLDAFEEYKNLDEDIKKEIQILADNVLRGIYEATKGICTYGIDIGDKYLSDLEYIVNIFVLDEKVQVVEN